MLKIKTGKQNSTTFETLPGATQSTNSLCNTTFVNNNNNEATSKPLEHTSSISNLKARLLESEQHSSQICLNKQQDKSSSQTFKSNQPSNTSSFARSFFMRKSNNPELSRFYHNRQRESSYPANDPIHDLELSETTCSLPNTPFKKKSKFLENNPSSNCDDENNLKINNTQSLQRNNSMLCSSTTNTHHNHMPFNRSRTSLSSHPIRTGNNTKHIWADSKEKSQSVQTLSSCSNKDEQLLQPCATNAAKMRMSGKRLSETNKSKHKQACCYIDKHWKVRVWQELTNFSLDFNGTVCVSATNNNNSILSNCLLQDGCDTNFKTNETSIFTTNDSPREDSHPLGFLGFRSLSNTPRGSDLSISSSSISNLSQQQHENVFVQFEHNCRPTISYSQDWSFKTNRRSESCDVPNSNTKQSSCQDNNNYFAINKTNKDYQISSKRLNDILWYRFLSRFVLRAQLCTHIIRQCFKRICLTMIFFDNLQAS
jgi:hypothetical protein